MGGVGTSMWKWVWGGGLGCGTAGGGVDGGGDKMWSVKS